MRIYTKIKPAKYGPIRFYRQIRNHFSSGPPENRFKPCKKQKQNYILIIKNIEKL